MKKVDNTTNALVKENLKIIFFSASKTFANKLNLDLDLLKDS